MGQPCRRSTSDLVDEQHGHILAGGELTEGVLDRTLRRLWWRQGSGAAASGMAGRGEGRPGCMMQLDPCNAFQRAGPLTVIHNQVVGALAQVHLAHPRQQHPCGRVRVNNHGQQAALAAAAVHRLRHAAGAALAAAAGTGTRCCCYALLPPRLMLRRCRCCSFERRARRGRGSTPAATAARVVAAGGRAAVRRAGSRRRGEHCSESRPEIGQRRAVASGARRAVAGRLPAGGHAASPATQASALLQQRSGQVPGSADQQSEQRSPKT